MISINGLDYYIGSRVLLEGADMHIRPNDKIGLIGLNGTGKSTLLRIINKELQPDEGAISRARNCTTGLLNQDLLTYRSDEVILNVALSAFEDILKLEHKIQELLTEMETNQDEKLVNRLTQLQEQFESLDGYRTESTAAEILGGIGFSTSDLHRPLSEFSGGWRMRVMLAKLLLEKPSLLMLDEPTNHLDLPSIVWLEDYLKNYEGAVIIVSHDRQFLDNAVNIIVEVSNRTLFTYPGNFTFYQSEKNQRNEIQGNAFRIQQKAIKQTERFITRFRAKASKARQVQSRVKMLDRLDRIDAVGDESVGINFRFRFTRKSGKIVAELKGLSKSYGDLTVFNNTSGTIERGDKIALIGANGKGKSTLLRIISQTESVNGQASLGHNVNYSFYAQHQLEALNLKREILEELKQVGSNLTELELRNLLGCFLFSGDDVFKKIKVLSGGEKARVALAKTLVSDSNFLLLDEPTNHLDVQSINILIQALVQYQGTYVFVSHDRDFISKVANKIWYIENENLKEYPGSYQEYDYWRSKNKIQSKAETKPKERKTKDRPRTHGSRELKKLREVLAELEGRIMDLEASKSKLESEIGREEIYTDLATLQRKSGELEGLSRKLEQLDQEWSLRVEEVEELESGSEK